MSEEISWHGWTMQQGVSLCIGMLPKRKRPCLYFGYTNEYCCRLVPIATFSNEEAAKEALSFLDLLILGKNRQGLD